MLKPVCIIAVTPPIDSLGKVTWLLFVLICMSITGRDFSHSWLYLVGVFSELLSGYDKKNFNNLWAIREIEMSAAEGESIYVETQNLACWVVLVLHECQR